MVLILQSCLIVMASNSKTPCAAESDSNCPFEMAEETTSGLESGEESELDRLQISKFPGKNGLNFVRCDHAVLAQRQSSLHLQENVTCLC